MAAAMSVIAIPEMTKRGYPDWLSGGLVATAGGIAILIPPSIPLLIYGIVTETSVVRLFFAGVIPGLLLALGNIITVIVIAMWLKLPRGGKFDGAPGAGARSKGALPALGMPVVILGGLYGGLFTPTEAAAAACGYAHGLRARSSAARAIRARSCCRPRCAPLNLTGVILFLIGSVGVFQFLAANMYWPQRITDTIVELGTDAARLHLRVHGGAADPRHVRRRRGDDPAHRAGDLPGRLRDEDRPGRARHHARRSTSRWAW